MASEYAREYLAEEIEKEVQSAINRIFMEEYELVLNPKHDTPF